MKPVKLSDDRAFERWLVNVHKDNCKDVVNVRDHPGWQDDPRVFYVGRSVGKTRGKPYANPFMIPRNDPEDRFRLQAMRGFIRWFRARPTHLAELAEIARALAEGKQLACWCAPKMCEAHILAGWAKALAKGSPNAPKASRPKARDKSDLVSVPA